MSWSVLLNQLALLNFAVATLLFFRGRNQSANSGFLRIATWLFAFATLTLAANLIASLALQEAALSSQRWYFIAALIGSICLALEHWLPVMMSARYASPLCFLLLLKAVHDDGRILHGLPSFVEFHVAAALMGLLLALLAGVLSAMYLWQEYLLKNRQLLRLYPSAPALDTIDRSLSACLWTGFCFLSAALVSGTITSQFISKQNLSFSSKTYLSYGVWVWYLIILIGRSKIRMPSTQMAKMSIFGLFLLLVVFFGLSF